MDVQNASALDPAPVRGEGAALITAGSQVLRVLLGVLGVLSLLIGVAALVLDADALRALAMLVFLFLGVGAAPWQANPRLGGYERLVMTFVTAVGVMTLVPMVMITLDFWHPAEAFTVAAAVSLPLLIKGVIDVAQEVNDSRNPGWLPRYFPVARSWTGARRPLATGMPATVVATTGAALCLLSALNHRHLVPGFYGFPRAIGPLWYVGLAMVLLAVTLLARPEHSRAIPVFLLVLCLTLTPALTYDGPRSQSAAKHVDFVMQIQSVHELASSVPIYNAYSGFFAAMAFLCDITGISDPIVLAAFWPPLLGVFRVIVLRYLAGQLLPRFEQSWVAVTLAVLADSIGADYFSPQSVGFTLGLALFGIALAKNTAVPRLWLILLGGVTLAGTHQLSPYVVSGVLLLLATYRVLRPWWAFILVLGPAVVWALVNWDSVSGFLSLDAFGQIQNFQPPKTDAAPTLERLPVVRATVLAALTGIVIVGSLALASLVRNRRQLDYWALASCAGVGIVLIALNPYGQEGIFRAVLFGIPWLAILAGPVLAGNGLGSRLALFAMTTTLAGAFLISSFGLDAINVIRPSDVAAVRLFREQGGPRPPDPYYLLLLNPGDHPTSPDVRDGKHPVLRLEDVAYPVPEKENFQGAAEVKGLTNRLLNYSAALENDAHLFALWSPVGQKYGEAYGIQTAGQSAALRDAFLQSPYWTIESEDKGTYLFRFEPARYEREAS